MKRPNFHRQNIFRTFSLFHEYQKYFPTREENFSLFSKCCNCSATFPTAFPVDLKILYQLSNKYWHLIFINKISIFANICFLTLSEWPLCGHTAFKFDFVRNPFSWSAAWLLSFNLFYTHFLNQLILPERVWLKFYPTFRRPIKENLVWPRKVAQRPYR